MSLLITKTKKIQNGFFQNSFMKNPIKIPKYNTKYKKNKKI